MAKFTPPLTNAEIEGAFAGRFTKPELINSGGQGSVYKCFAADGEVVAVKIYVPDSGAQVEERTDREVAALHYTNCPSIVALREYGQALLRGESCRVVTTAFIEGQTLGARIGSGQPMKIGEVARCACDIAAAINAMWESPARIVHRDIKPPNVMWTPQGRAVVIDLGIARHTTMESLTATGNMWGTPGYMSPEQARGIKRLSCKSDVFALGILLQACLCGRHPTNGDQRHLMRGAPSTVSVAPATDAAVAALIDRMLWPTPVERPMPRQIIDTFSRLLETRR